MMPALSLLLTNYTMGSLPCKLGGYPHTPSHAGCRVSPCDAGWLRSVKWMVGWELRNRGRKSKTEGYWVLKERRWNEEKVSAHQPVQGNPPGLIPQGAYMTHAWGQQRWRGSSDRYRTTPWVNTTGSIPDTCRRAGKEESRRRGKDRPVQGNPPGLCLTHAGG